MKPSYYPILYPSPSLIPSDPDYRPSPLEIKLYDFDNSGFLVSVHEDNLECVIVSLSLPCYRAIKDKGADDALQAAYGDLLVSPEDGYDVTIRVDSAYWKGKEEQTVDLISRLKRIALGGVFDHHLIAIHKKNISSLSNFTFDLRKDTTVYFLPQADRIQIVFRLALMDRADIEIGRVFLQQVADPTLNRRIQRAPFVSFDTSPPQAVAAAFNVQANPSDLGYFSFTLVDIHCSDEHRPRAVESLQVFRNFVQYHLKCAKSYFHSRMRLRVSELVKVLNRAKTVVENNQPKRITNASGRVLIR